MEVVKKPQRVLCVSTEKSDSGFGRYVHLRGFVSHLDESKPNGFESQSYSDSEICELRISSQGDDHSDKLYGWEIGYRAHDAVCLGDAEKVIKLLKPLYRKLGKMNEVEGYPQSFGTWINRVARAIGATKVFTWSEERKQQTGYGWASSSLCDAVSRIDVMAHDAIEYAKQGRKAA